MHWLQSNWQIAASIAAAVIWLAQNYGSKAVTTLRALAAKVSPNGTTGGLQRWWPLLVFAVLLGPKILPQVTPQPVQPQRVPDIFDQSAASGRSLLADELDEIARTKFETVQDKEDTINQKILDIVQSCFEPVNVRIGKAAEANRLTDMAELIRKGELRE